MYPLNTGLYGTSAPRRFSNHAYVGGGGVVGGVGVGVVVVWVNTSAKSRACQQRSNAGVMSAQ